MGSEISAVNSTTNAMYQTSNSQVATDYASKKIGDKSTSSLSIESMVDSIPKQDTTKQKKPFENVEDKPSEDGKKLEDVSPSLIKDAIEKINSGMNRKTQAEFSYHEKTGRISIKIIDSNTNEVVREVPPEKTLDMIAKMWEFAGIIVDEKR